MRVIGTSFLLAVNKVKSRINGLHCVTPAWP